MLCPLPGGGGYLPEQGFVVVTTHVGDGDDGGGVGDAKCRKAGLLVELLVAIPIEPDGVEESVVVGVLVFHYGKALGQCLLTLGPIDIVEAAHVLIVFSPLVDAPRAPLCSIEVYLAVDGTDVEGTVAGVVGVELPTVADGIGLGVVVESAVALSDLVEVEWLIELYALPTLAVVVFIEGEPDAVPPAVAEDEGEALLVVGEDELGVLPPLGVEEVAVGFGESAELLIDVAILGVGCGILGMEVNGHVEVEGILGVVVVVEIDTDCRPRHLAVGVAAEIGLTSLVAEADGHLSEAVVVGVEEEEGVFPVEADVGHPFGGAVELQEGGVAVVVGVEVGQPVVEPAAELEGVEVDVVEHIVAVEVDDVHVVSGAGAVVAFLAVLDHQLDVGMAIGIGVGPVDDEVVVGAVESVAVAVDHEAVVDLVAGKVADAHVVVVVDPLDGCAVGGDGAEDVGLSVAGDVVVADGGACEGRCQAQGVELGGRVPPCGGPLHGDGAEQFLGGAHGCDCKEGKEDEDGWSFHVWLLFVWGE